jgi:cell division protein FtsX
VLPIAHVGHYLWIFYILPVFIVIAGTIRTTLAQRREDGED